MVSKFLDDTQKKKVRVLGSDFKEQMALLIDRDNLPEEYGGTQAPLDLWKNEDN